jgi:hypothetical protein
MAALAGKPIDGATLEAGLKAVQEDVKMDPNAPGVSQPSSLPNAPRDLIAV